MVQVEWLQRWLIRAGVFVAAALLIEFALDFGAQMAFWLDDFARDLAYAWRVLRKSPGFAAVGALSLALGIGANTAIFRLVYWTLLESLPVREPERLFTISRGNLERGNMTSLPHPFFRELLAKNSIFEGLVCWTGGTAAIGDERESRMASAQLVSGNFFDVLGVKPMLGRTLKPEDDRTLGAHPVLVLSHNYWMRRFCRISRPTWIKTGRVLPQASISAAWRRRLASSCSPSQAEWPRTDTFPQPCWYCSDCPESSF